jgi:hypothetical protein
MNAVSQGRWVVSEAELIDVDLVTARALVVKCFMTAQKETFAQTKEQMGLPGDERSLERSVLGAVRVAFKRAGGDFDHPTKDSIQGACQSLAATSCAWGTPPDVVAHHTLQIQKVLSRLPD